MDPARKGADSVCPRIVFQPIHRNKCVPRRPGNPDGAQIETDVRQQPIEPLVPQPRFLQRETRSAEGMIAEKEMLEAWCKSFQHGTCIAVANGSEQAHHTPTNDCMVHARLPRSMIEKSYSRQKRLGMACKDFRVSASRASDEAVMRVS